MTDMPPYDLISAIARILAWAEGRTAVDQHAPAETMARVRAGLNVPRLSGPLEFEEMLREKLKVPARQWTSLGGTS